MKKSTSMAAKTSAPKKQAASPQKYRIGGRVGTSLSTSRAGPSSSMSPKMHPHLAKNPVVQRPMSYIQATRRRAEGGMVKKGGKK